jgi:hypothetical protein
MIELLPPRPKEIKKIKRVITVLQWFFSPLVAAALGSPPAVDAQTRLMLGKYMHQFNVTEKSRKNIARDKSL